MACVKLATAAAAALTLISMCPASAQETYSSEDIIVTGRRVREMAEAYAGAVALAPEAADQYARWNFRLCPSVAGLAPADAQNLIDHIARRAHEVDVETERTGCQPNLVIIFTPDPGRLAQEIVDTRRDLMGYYTEDEVITAGREALDDFVHTPRAVRWWHVSRTVGADGRPLGGSTSRAGRGDGGAVAAASGGSGADIGAAIRGGTGFTGVDTVRSNGTRSRRATRQDLNFALVLVDSARAAEAPPMAMADYLTMAALVQLDPGANMSAYPTILNLFAERPPGAVAPTGLTAWDIAYLQGLYASRREAASARQQRTAIARRISEDVRR
jgi:hypothetical protein